MFFYSIIMSLVVRYKSPLTVHLLSWTIALEKNGSVACHFKGCKFMALSLEEMGQHYSYCQSHNSKYEFACEICSCRTDAIEKLLLHKLYSHSCKLSDEENSKISEYQNRPVKKYLTSMIRRSWIVFLKNKKYVKCLSRQCQYVTNDVEDIKDHYLHSCKPSFWSSLKYECEFCYGKVTNKHDLKVHIAAAHESKIYLKRSTSPEAVPVTSLDCVELWSNQIQSHKQGTCFYKGCRFVDNNFKILEKHYASCNGQKRQNVTCTICGAWVQSYNRLVEHERCIHKGFKGVKTTPQIVKIETVNEHEESEQVDLNVDDKDALWSVKRIKTEDTSDETPAIADIPVWYLEPDNNSVHSIKTEVLEEDPLASSPSTSKEELETTFSGDVIPDKIRFNNAYCTKIKILKREQQLRL